MGKRSPLRWPKSRQVFAPMAHAHVGYHTSGAADGTKECCESGGSIFCERTRTYNGAVEWIHNV